MSIAKELQARLTKSKISYEELYGILQHQNTDLHTHTSKQTRHSHQTKTSDFMCDFPSDEVKNSLSIEDAYLQVELLRAQGLPLESSGDAYFLAHNERTWREQEFCFVDIETTGSKPDTHQIIEIGAIKWKNGEILGRFSELIYAYFVPESITQITQIDTKMLENARNTKEVLRDFKQFLAQSVFVAHNVGFDYSFVSYHLEQLGFGELLNPKLCTIDLAKKTILARRYSLKFLNEFLGINTPTSHRAYADALTALRIFEIASLCLPNSVCTTQDIIDFSKNANIRF